MSHSVSIITHAVVPSGLSLQVAGSIRATHSDANRSFSDAVNLYESGCTTHGQLNCTLACQDPGTVWSSPYAIHNCLAYPTIAALLSSGNLTDDAAAIASAYGILPDTDSAITISITHTMATCASSACANVANRRQCQFQLYAANYIASEMTDPEFWECRDTDAEVFVNHICEGSPASANADVGGIGVYISYLMQLTIVLFAYLYDRTLSTWLGRTYLIVRPHAPKLQKTLDAKQRPALTAGLVDFQKAQAYFAITLQGAALLAIWRGGTLLDATTYPQVGVTISLIGDVAASGIVCIVFGLYMLHTAQKTSTYVSTLSTLAVVMSLVTWTRTRMPMHPTNFEIDTFDAPNISACGGKISPAKFCASYDMVGYTASFEAPFVAISGCILLVLLFSQSRSALVRMFRKVPLCPSWLDVAPPKLRYQEPSKVNELTRRMLFCAARVWKIIHHGAVEITLVVMAVVMLIWLVAPGAFGVNSAYDRISWRQDPQWTFGQLIAVTIWAPVMIEYVYSAIWGVEEAHEHRLASPYKVIKQKEDRESKPETRSVARTGTFYTRLGSHSELELPLVHAHDAGSVRSSFQGA